MDQSLENCLTPLNAGQILRLPGGAGRSVAVFSGSLWVTEEGDSADNIVAAGESFALTRPGWAVVQALEPSFVLELAADVPPAAPRLPLARWLGARA